VNISQPKLRSEKFDDDDDNDDNNNNVEPIQAVYYNVTLRRVPVTTVAVENQYVLHILNVCVFILTQVIQHTNHIFPV